MAKAIRSVFKNETISLTECTDGYWLYDYIRGMNLSMRAKTELDAFVEALTYYQERLAEVGKEYKVLRERVDSFVSQFKGED